MSNENIAIAENIMYSNKELRINGYSCIRNMEIGDAQKKYLVIKNELNDVHIQLLQNSLRTDLQYIFKNDKVDYTMCGFEEIIIPLDTLEYTNGKYLFYIRIEFANFSIDIPLKVRVAEQKNKFKRHYFRLNNDDKVLKWTFSNMTDLGMHINKSSSRDKIKHYLKDIKRYYVIVKKLIKRRELKTIIVLVLNLFFARYLKRRDIWLIGERKDTAQDNSYHLFKYITKKHPNIKIYYIINNKCKDFNKVSFGPVINHGSIKHSLYMLCCKYSINSYSERSNMYTNEYKTIIKHYPNIINRKKVFLQHGVIATSRINHSLHKNKVDYDLFVTSSDFEKQHIVSEFGYKNEEVVVTGLCRWDNLNEYCEENIILVMPTWRSWIKSEKELKESEYFKRYISLLTNEEFIRILRNNNYVVRFYPHYHMQKLIENMNIDFNEKVQFITTSEESVQGLLKRSKILITDYSSVTFDFGYMKKPVVFYQFDYNDFYLKHYNEGPIDHNKDLFGDVVIFEKDIIELINSLCINTTISQQNEKKISKFIKYKDNRNCERVMNEIIKLEYR